MSERLPETDDFGLAPGEEFEPDLPPEPPFDLARPHIMTVLGPIEPDALGLVLPHEHVVAAPALGGVGDRFDDEHLALAELEDFYVTGGRALVDATAVDSGRDLAALHWIAERSPVTLIAATGAGGPSAADSSASELADGWIRELRDGVGALGVRPGVIVAEEAAGEVALRAAARAQMATGAPIITTTATPNVHRIMADEAVPPDRVIVGVRAEDLEESAESVLAVGHWLMIDRIGLGTVGLAGMEERARGVWRLIEAGFVGQLLCSLHLTRRAEWRSGGGEGWGMIVDRWSLALMEAGAEAAVVRQLLVENPARALAVRQ